MPSLLTTRDPQGGMRFRPLAIPLLIAAIAVPVAAAMALSGTQLGAGLGMAVGALAATALIVFAARSKPMRRVEVAESEDAGHRVLVVAVTEATAEAAERIAELAGSPFDVRVVVPVASQRLDRWLSAEDEARHEAEARLGPPPRAPVAAGLAGRGAGGGSGPPPAPAG